MTDVGKLVTGGSIIKISLTELFPWFLLLQQFFLLLFFQCSQMWTISFLCSYYHLGKGASGTNSKLIAEKGKFGPRDQLQCIRQENKFLFDKKIQCFETLGQN